MSNEVDRGLTLQGIMASAADIPLEEPLREVRRAARHLALATYTDPHWGAAQTARRGMATDSTYDAILARQEGALAGITNSLRDRAVPAVTIEHPSALEPRAAESDLRIHLRQILTQLPEVELAANQIAADPEKRVAIERITGRVKATDPCRISPFALLCSSTRTSTSWVADHGPKAT
jgi:hypothetical protein